MSQLLVAPTPTLPFRSETELDRDDFLSLRRRMVLEGFKWDPQVGDVSTIARFPIVLPLSRWRELQFLAERLAAELESAENELLHRPDLHHRLGLPWRLRRLLRSAASSPAPAAARILRFDFHWTDDGWRISEVNSDVPSGFTESSNLPRLMAKYYPHLRIAGNPAADWADAVAATARGPHIALLAATGFMEDQQIVAYLASLLAERGFIPHLVGLSNLTCDNSHRGAAALAAVNPILLGGIVRFYQAEWLAARPAQHIRSMLFGDSQTPVYNPGTAALTESKRFPLVWNDLSTPLPTWRSLLPETRDPRHAPWMIDDAWLVKSAMCNTGDTVSIRSQLTPLQWRKIVRDVRWWPSHWIAQRRFSPLPLETPAGPVYPCIGVFTINGRAAGIYGRFSYRPLIDFAAVDVAVLIEEQTR
jgi:glutathionylspermidine synthase